MGPPAQGAHGFSGFSSVAGALKLVQIPAGARHIQIEELEKVPHHIGECARVLSEGQPALGCGGPGRQRQDLNAGDSSQI